MDLDRLRRAGEQFTQSGQEMIKANIDDPVQEKLRQLAAVKAASEMAQKGAPGALNPMGMPMVQPQANVAPQVENPLPGGFSASQVQGLEGLAKLKERDRAIKAQLEAEAQAQAQAEAEFDPSSYQPYKRQEEVPVRRFEGLKSRMTAPVQTGPIELSDDPEEMQRQIEAAHRGR